MLDSTALTALAARSSPGKLSTFAMGFGEFIADELRATSDTAFARGRRARRDRAPRDRARHFQPNIRRSFQPDVLVARKEDIGEKKLIRPPVLAIEVLSPGTALVDLNLKRKAYAENGITSYRVLDPARRSCPSRSPSALPSWSTDPP